MELRHHNVQPSSPNGRKTAWNSLKRIPALERGLWRKDNRQGSPGNAIWQKAIHPSLKRLRRQCVTLMMRYRLWCTIIFTQECMRSSVHSKELVLDGSMPEAWCMNALFAGHAS